MPTFCRHNRLVQNCPICREPEPPASARRAPRRSSSGTSARTRSPSTASARRPSRGGELKVRRVGRAPEDGYQNDLVPGLRASKDAGRLADELAFAAVRLALLETGPPGAYAEAASAPDREEGLWLGVLIALIGPIDGDDPFANVRAARVPWSSGELPALDDLALGPRGGVRSASEAQAALRAYRAWAERAGSQSAAIDGEPGWSPQRRFERAYERLGTLRGFGRDARYDLLVTLGRLGLADVRAGALHVGDRDPASLAARRVFGIADRMLLERRAAELAAACDVPVEALDLALFNWSGERDRAAMGVPPETVDAAVRDGAAAALGVG